jgi:NTE family protein
MTESAVSAFAVVFGIFVVGTVVLIVLVLRFTFQRAAIARERLMADRSRPVNEALKGGVGDGDNSDKPMTALVFAGGGTRGAVQIGMLQVLAEHGFVPDRIYGVSVGAVNGAGFAGDPTPEGVERMARIWTALTHDDVYPQGRLHGPWLYFQQRDAVYSNSGLRKIIEEGVSFARLEDAPIPFEVVATSLMDGRERWFTYGPSVEVILASSALPAIFPPVEIDGERYIDGGVVNNVPIRRAIDAGAKRIVVLMCSPPVFTPGRARRPIEAVLNALFIAVHARFGRDMAQLPPDVEVMVCSAGAPGDGGPGFGDFSLTAELIAEGRREAAEVVRRYELGSPGAGSASTAGVTASRAASTDATGPQPGPTAAGPASAPTTDGRRTVGAALRRLGLLRLALPGRRSPDRGRSEETAPRSPAASEMVLDGDVASPTGGDPAVSAAVPSTGSPTAAVPAGDGPAPSTHPDPGT